MSAFGEIIDIVLSSDVLLYLGLIADGILSIFLCKKSKKADNKSLSTTEEDINSLIEYHENVAKKLKEKFNKGE